jgi:hypothetical protein
VASTAPEAFGGAGNATATDLRLGETVSILSLDDVTALTVFTFGVLGR